MKTKVLLLLAALAAFPGLRADDQDATTESRLRDALRNTMSQLRDAQNQLVTLQATQAQSDKDNADLKAKVDELNTQITTLTKQSGDDKAAADKSIADLKAQLADQTAEVARLNQSVAEWKNAYNQTVQLANAREQARAQLALQAALLQRTVDDREMKNLELYRTASEILTRYEKFGLGDAIGAKEPFVGLSRVKLENMVQGYKDKILDETVTPGQPPSAAANEPLPVTVPKSLAAPTKTASAPVPTPVKTPLASTPVPATQP
ncbi:MAG: hypothetical protein LV479_05880 [Methylacidiphilales bacterium]|nr:hypothetical protein [Candidatus Methylacidiphilales bacterium]